MPLDAVYAYYWRAKRAAQALPAASRLGWLEHVDTAERAVWVSEFRDSDKSLSTVIKEVFTQRDAHWEANVAAPSHQPPPQQVGKAQQVLGGAHVKVAPGTRLLRQAMALCAGNPSAPDQASHSPVRVLVTWRYPRSPVSSLNEGSKPERTATFCSHRVVSTVQYKWLSAQLATPKILARGRSDSDDLDSLARIIHCALFALRTLMYFE